MRQLYSPIKQQECWYGREESQIMSPWQDCSMSGWDLKNIDINIDQIMDASFYVACCQTTNYSTLTSRKINT